MTGKFSSSVKLPPRVGVEKPAGQCPYVLQKSSKILRSLEMAHKGRDCDLQTVIWLSIAP